MWLCKRKIEHIGDMNEKDITRQAKRMVEKYELKLLNLESIQAANTQKQLDYQKNTYENRILELKGEIGSLMYQLKHMREENHELREVNMSLISKINAFRNVCKCPSKDFLN